MLMDLNFSVLQGQNYYVNLKEHIVSEREKQQSKKETGMALVLTAELGGGTALVALVARSKVFTLNFLF